MRRYIENHFGVVLLAACVAGLVMPGLNLLPNGTAVLVLAALMFVSCYRLRDGGFATIRWRDVGVFYVLRYGVLPVGLWALAHALVPEYAMGIFLLTLLPAGVSSPAIAHIYGGAVAPGFAIVIVSQLLTPFLIPLQFAWLGHFDAQAAVQAAPSPGALFVTMVWCIFVPILVYAGVRKHRRMAAYFYRQNKLFSMLLVAFVIALAIAKQREIILAHGAGLAVSLGITLLCFSGYIMFGWMVVRGRPREERITFAVCSSFNNAALGVSLALLHFSAPVILFVAVSEIAWALLPVLLGFFLRRF